MTDIKFKQKMKEWRIANKVRKREKVIGMFKTVLSRDQSPYNSILFSK